MRATRRYARPPLMVVDAFAPVDALDGCIGFHNRLVTRLMNNARARAEQRLGCRVNWVSAAIHRAATR